MAIITDNFFQIAQSIRIFESAVIILYLWFIGGWNAPETSPWKRSLQCLERLVIYIGVYHSWALFAPRPYGGVYRMEWWFEQANGTWHRAKIPLFETNHPGFDTRIARLLHHASMPIVRVSRIGLARFVTRHHCPVQSPVALRLLIFHAPPNPEIPDQSLPVLFPVGSYFYPLESGCLPSVQS
ncbi:hypothetical protein EBR96_09115 [bacterium]|nr:hypothetical protein [bacterium]